MPYTLLLMSKVNGELSSEAQEAEASSGGKELEGAAALNGGSVKELLDSWATHNFARGFLPLSAAILGLWTSL